MRPLGVWCVLVLSLAPLQATRSDSFRPLPDLLIEAITIQGVDNRIVVGLTNRGFANVRPDLGTLSVFVDEVRVRDIPFSSISEAQFLLATGRAAVDTGVHLSGNGRPRRLLVTVDSYDEIPEIDETHNHILIEWDPPRRVGYDFRLSAAVDDREHLYFEVDNVGNRTAPENGIFSIRFEVAEDAGMEFSPIVPELAPGRSAVITPPVPIRITQSTRIRAVLVPDDVHADLDNANDVYEGLLRFATAEDVAALYGPLLDDPWIGGSMRWLDTPDAFGYAQWPDDLRQQLEDYLLELERGGDPTLQDPPERLAGGHWTRDDMVEVYAGLVAQSLWFEIHGRGSWSLCDLSPGDLELLFDLHEIGFTQVEAGYKVSTWKAGAITPWNSRRLYKAVASMGLLRPTDRETAAALANWMSYVRHGMNEESAANVHTRIVNYGYAGLVPADRIIYPMHDGLPEHVAYQGCWTRTGFFKAVLGGLNIPARNGMSIFDTVGVHSRLELPSVGRPPDGEKGIAIAHSDDIGLDHGLDLFVSFAEIDQYIDYPVPFCDDNSGCAPPAQQSSFNKEMLERRAGAAHLWPRYVVERADGVLEATAFVCGSQTPPYLSEEEVSAFLLNAEARLMEVGEGDIHLGADRLQHKGAAPLAHHFYEPWLEIPDDYGAAPTTPLVRIDHPRGTPMVTQHIAHPRPSFHATFYEPGGIPIKPATFQAKLVRSDVWPTPVEDISAHFRWSANAVNYEPSEDIQIGHYILTIRISNTAGQTGKSTSTFSIEPTLSIILDVPEVIVAGSAFSHALAGAGGRLEYHWSLASGMLPWGLTLSEDGLIAGKPLSAGRYDFSIDLRDSDHNHAYASFSVRVDDAVDVATGAP